jgi:hypothetical protein
MSREGAKMKYWDKEDVYDAQISPLMKQIIAICQEHHMPIVFSVQYANDEGKGPALCTTTLTPEEWEPSEKMVRLNQLHQPERPVCLAETHQTMPDGSKQITITRVR